MKDIAKLALVAVLALCSATAFAGNKSSLYISIFKDSSIAGVKVPVGEYKMIVDQTGEAVKVSLMRNGRTIVSTDAHLVKISGNLHETAVVTDARSSEITEIRVAKLKGAVVFDQHGAETASGK